MQNFKLKGSLLLIFWFAFSSSILANENKDYYLVHQVGANQGIYAFGVGCSSESIHEPSISFGYTPDIADVGHDITQLNFKFNFRWYQSKNVQLLSGLSLLMNASPDTYFKLPKKYPNKYYPPNAYFFAIQHTIRHHNFFIEASVLDYYIEVLARNSFDTFPFEDRLSIGFGYVQDVDWEPQDLLGYFSSEAD